MYKKKNDLREYYFHLGLFSLDQSKGSVYSVVIFSFMEKLNNISNFGYFAVSLFDKVFKSFFFFLIWIKLNRFVKCVQF